MQRSNVGDDWREGQELCFDPSIFIKENFSIDEFLRSHRNKATLEVLRNDLGSYLKTLRLSMIELINKDYEDFVNLSKHLVGLNAGIEVLESPLEQVRAEILVVRTSLQEAIDGLKQCLERNRLIKEKKQQLFHLTQALESLKRVQLLLKEKEKIDLNLIERASREFSMLHFLVSQCEAVLSSSRKKAYESAEKLLMDYLCNVFLESLADKKTNEIDRCLRIFYNLNQVGAAISLIRNDLVAPYLNTIISEAALLKEEEGLRGIFHKLLAFLDGPLLPLFTAPAAVLGKFHFLVSAFWTELVQRFEVHMKSVFAAGDPNVFYQRFTDTMAFLDQLRQRCQTPQVLDSHPSTAHFMHKWNLLVYYKIRFQEIAGLLENVVSNPTSVEIADVYRFGVTGAAFSCLQRCWRDGIFMPQLSHSFWKLSVQIISRYCTWVETEAIKGCQPTNTSNDLTNSGPPTSPEPRITRLASIYQDCHHFTTTSLEYLQTVKAKLPAAFTESTAFVESVASSEKQLEKAKTCLSNQIISILVQTCIPPLCHVKDIPRLFRKTNRDMPTKPCDYVQAVINPIRSFIEGSTIEKSCVDSWMTQVLLQVTTEFYSYVNNVIESAQKTEESLRRLKKAKDKSAVTNSGVTDDDKIKQQLLVDVYSFRDKAVELNAPASEIEILKQLVQLVESAKEKSER